MSPAGGSRVPATLPAVLWVLAVCLAAVVLALARVRDLPVRVAPGAAGVVVVLLVVGLAVRTGGRALLPAALAVALAAVAVLTLWPPLLAGGAVAAAVLAGCLAVLATTPAASYPAAVREVVLASVLATVAGLAVAGFDQPVLPDRFGYVSLGVGLLAAFGLVYRLGAGFHGVGRRGLVIAVGALLVLAAVVAYSVALGRWGAPGLVDGVDGLRHAVRVHLQAVPHPIETLLGVPALAWGVRMRARLRQGWWMCAFGVALTVPATTRFIEYGVPPLTTVLGAAYSLVLGLVVGYLVVRVDRALTGTHHRHAEQHGAVRLEPGRFSPLQ